MTSRLHVLALSGAALVAAGGIAAASLSAQQALIEGDAQSARAELEKARRDGARARQRAEQLEAEARRVTEEADKTARESAALAARIQETEAEVKGHEARIALIGGERRKLAARLAERQRPVVRLTAALQRLSRRPPALALFRPGSVRDTMHMRALLDTMIPQVEQRTAALRQEIEHGKALERQAGAAATQLKGSEKQLVDRREALVALESRQRLASREAAGIAAREADRALALAERVRDLDELVDALDAAGELREQLAALPGPILRPSRPEQSEVAVAEEPAEPEARLSEYILPVAGTVVTGFGEDVAGAPRSQGLSLSALAGAQVVSPGRGRVAFAGPYRGYGRIVIIEHPGGWTSLVTGLARLDTSVGRSLVAGSPLGLAGPGKPVITLELRQEGEPVNPLQYVQSL
jgi:septal ring factor EnvC (AmiA/AmiB activator)